MEKKYYTFIDITDGPDAVKNITTELILTRPENREVGNGNKVLTCSAAFSNQTKALSKALGTEIRDNDGAVWADIQFWNDAATRFEKFLNGREKVKLILCGRLTLRTWETKNGEPAQRVCVSVRNWKDQHMTASPTTSESENFSDIASETDTDDMPF